MSRIPIAGVPIDCISLADAVNLIVAPTEEARTVHLCNAWTITHAQEHSTHLAALRCGTINLPDGAPVAWLAGWLAVRKPARSVPGPELMRAVLSRERATRHYLYGSSERVLLDLRRTLAIQFPHAQVVGSSSPPMGQPSPSWALDLADRLRVTRPNVVWVGLGTPKQDLFLPRIAELCSVTYVAVGAAFDYLSGHKSEAPGWLRGSGFEWVYRLAAEPRRLWRRYLLGNAKFMRIAAMEWAHRYRTQGGD